MSKQPFVWSVKKKLPNDSNVWYTSHVRRCTLHPNNDFRFEGTVCGVWAFNDECLIIDFRAGGGVPTFVHIFMETKSKHCWRLVGKDEQIYDAIDGIHHNNAADDYIVLLLKVPDDDIEIQE